MTGSGAVPPTRERRDWRALPWATGVGLWLPLWGVASIFKARRVAWGHPEMSARQWLDALRPEACLYAAAACATVGLVAAARGRHRKAIRVGLGVALIVTFLVEAIAHNFQQITGVTLDASLVLFFFRHIASTAAVATSELAGSIAFAIVGPILYRLFGPRAPVWARLRAREASVPADAKPAESVLPGLLLIVLALVFLGTMPRFSDLPRSIVRTPLHQLWATLPSHAEADTAAGPPLAPGRLVEDRAAAHGGPVRGIVIFVLESVGARRTTLYDPTLPTTPWLASIAGDDSTRVVPRAYAVVPHTSKALVTILCGITPYPHVGTTETLPNALPVNCLPTLLRDQGWDTAFFQTVTGDFEMRRDFVRRLGFEHFVDLETIEAAGEDAGFATVNYFGLEDRALMKASERWIGARDAPFFAVYLTNTTHHPYGVPPSMKDTPPMATSDDLDRHLRGVRYLDGVIRDWIAQYEAAGRAKDVLFVVLGDHGEAFGEHGRFQHDSVVYEEGIHVPLLFRRPGATLPTAPTTPVSQLDLLPTLATFAGYRAEGSYEGRDLFADDHAPRRIFAQCWYERRCAAVIDPPYHYVHHFGDRPAEVFDLGSGAPTTATDDANRRWRTAVDAWQAHSERRFRAHLQR